MLKKLEVGKFKFNMLFHLPFWLLILLAVLAPFDQYQRDIFLGMSLQRIVFIFLVGLFCIGFIQGNRRIYFTPLIIPLILYFISHFIGAFHAEPTIAIESILRMFGYILLFLISANLPKSRGQVISVLLVLIVSLFLVEISAVFKMLTHKSLLGLNLIKFPQQTLHPVTFRLLGTSHNPNSFATLFVIVLPISMCFAIAYKNFWMRLVFSLSYFFGLICLLATQSKSGLLGVSGGLIVALVYLLRKGKNRKRLVLWVIFLPLMTLLVFNQFSGLRQINLGARLGDKEAYKLERDNQRIRILTKSLKFVMAHPFGAGPGKIGEKIAEYSGSSGDEKKHSPHNMFLSEGAQNGWLGIISLILLWGLVFFHLVSGIKRSDSEFEKILILAFLSSFTAIFIHNQFHSLLGWNIVWLIIGLAFATLRMSKQSFHETVR